jgi:IMP dehydrogenase
MRTGLSYDDVCMLPTFNNIPSRNDESMDFSTKLSADCHMSIPIVAANMDTVINAELGEVLQDYGSSPILHRFHKTEADLKEEIARLRGACFISCGADPSAAIKIMTDAQTTGVHMPLGICIDVAHGHSSLVETAIKRIRELPKTQIIAGNVCTAQAFHDLVNWGADAVKVGIGPGSVCTTREVTPFGVPQFTAIQDCAKISKDFQVPMIADGGIKGSREIVLALAAGASSVMIGGLFARTAEAMNGNRLGVYRGQASEHFQNDYYGGMKDGTVPEGKAQVLGPCLGSAKEVIENLLGGMRTSFTYGGANSIAELQRKAEFMRITDAY